MDLPNGAGKDLRLLYMQLAPNLPQNPKVKHVICSSSFPDLYFRLFLVFTLLKLLWRFTLIWFKWKQIGVERKGFQCNFLPLHSKRYVCIQSILRRWACQMSNFGPFYMILSILYISIQYLIGMGKIIKVNAFYIQNKGIFSMYILHVIFWTRQFIERHSKLFKCRHSNKSSPGKSTYSIMNFSVSEFKQAGLLQGTPRRPVSKLVVRPYTHHVNFMYLP